MKLKYSSLSTSDLIGKYRGSVGAVCNVFTGHMIKNEQESIDYDCLFALWRIIDGGLLQKNVKNLKMTSK